MKLSFGGHYRFATFFFFYYGFLGIVSPYLSLYFDHIGFTAIQISLLMSMLQITRILGPFAWGWLADFRQNRIEIMRLTSLMSLILFLGIFWVNSFTYFLIWMFLLNTFSSSLTPLGEAATLHALNQDNQFVNRYGRLRLWGSIGFMLAVFLGGFWFEDQGISTLPWVGLGLITAVAICAWCLWEPPITTQPMERGQLRQIMKKKEVIWFFSSAFWMIFAHAALYVFFSLYLEKKGYGKQVIGFFWMIGVGAEVLFFYFQKWVYGKLRAEQIISWACGFGVIRFLIVAYLPEFWPLIIVQLLHAFTFAAHHSASIQILQKWFKGSTQARGQALYTTISYGLGGSIGGVAAGWVWEHLGPEHVFAMAAGACFISLLSIQRVIKRVHYIPE
ncbi:MAG: MFS transporter [Betaproteobacteria bacterium]